MLKNKLAVLTAFTLMLPSTFALAASNKDIKTSRAESDVPASSSRRIFGNSFNPSIGVILNGRYSNFSRDDSEITGFAVGEEGERGREGISIGESELNFSASVDDKFYGSVTAALVHEDGGIHVELEEAYIQTSPGLGLPSGLTIKGGRALWTIGYLNEHHAHTDDFTDRPLPYRVFLNKAFNDDGLELSYVLPINFYLEIGGGVFRGDDFPFGGAAGGNIGAWSVFSRVGSDIGQNQNWRLGFSILSGKAKGEEGRSSNEDQMKFIGKTNLYVADLRYTWAPTGNARDHEVSLQSEFFWRQEDGTYKVENPPTATDNINDDSNGWYVQTVYKFLQQWRVGIRYSQLEAAKAPPALIDSPKTVSAMMGWTNSEFSNLRFQYNYEKLDKGKADNQFILQYTISLGAHGAHKY